MRYSLCVPGNGWILWQNVQYIVYVNVYGIFLEQMSVFVRFIWLTCWYQPELLLLKSFKTMCKLSSLICQKSKHSHSVIQVKLQAQCMCSLCHCVYCASCLFSMVHCWPADVRAVRKPHSTRKTFCAFSCQLQPGTLNATCNTAEPLKQGWNRRYENI